MSLDGESGSGDAGLMHRHRYRLHVQRIDATKNMARFYLLSIEPTLFGNISLVRNWGRMGTRGQERVHFFENEKEALTLFLDILREKRKKGYRPAPRCGNHRL